MRLESWLPAAPESAPKARALVRAAADDLGIDGRTAWDLMLATTEAVANAVEHGEPCDPRGILLRIEARADGIGVEVCDCGGCFPRSAKPREEGGRGLPIIAAVMDNLEIVPDPGATRVRFEKRFVAA